MKVLPTFGLAGGLGIDGRARWGFVLTVAVWLLLPYPCLVAADWGRSVRSSSGQFLVMGRPGSVSTTITNLAPSGVTTIRLEPNPLTVLCERVKQGLLAELGMGDFWRGRIRLLVMPYAQAGQPINIQPELQPEGWTYQLDVPGQVEPTTLVRALVQVLLQEIANRNNPGQPPELPHWLAEGLIARIWGQGSHAFLLQPQAYSIQTTRVSAPIQAACVYLSTNSPLSFTQLSAAPVGQLTADQFTLFRQCAFLLVNELMRLPAGRERLVVFLQTSARCMNWQTAFLAAFKDHFGSLLAVEKWWALTLANLTGKDPTQLWTVDVSVRKLEEILRTPAKISASKTEVPRTVGLTLQQLVSTWEPRLQRQALRQKVGQLGAARAHLAPALAAYADRYRALLEGYLQAQTRNLNEARPTARLDPKVTTERLVRDLNELDAAYQATLQQLSPPPTFPGGTAGEQAAR